MNIKLGEVKSLISEVEQLLNDITNTKETFVAVNTNKNKLFQYYLQIHLTLINMEEYKARLKKKMDQQQNKLLLEYKEKNPKITLKEIDARISSEIKDDEIFEVSQLINKLKELKNILYSMVYTLDTEINP